MFYRTRQFFSRLMLAVMLVTFLSPLMGWGMIASHEQLSHSTNGVENTVFVNDHHRPVAPDVTHDHQDAHTSIGHLLTDMPVGMFATPSVGILSVTQVKLPFLNLAILHVDPEPLLRPPRTTSRI